MAALAPVVDCCVLNRNKIISACYLLSGIGGPSRVVCMSYVATFLLGCITHMKVKYLVSKNMFIPTVKPTMLRLKTKARQ